MDRLRWLGTRRRRTPGPTYSVQTLALAFVLGFSGVAMGYARADASAAVLRGQVVDSAGAPIAWASVEVRYPTEKLGPAGLRGLGVRVSLARHAHPLVAPQFRHE
jgi:hypothetical protein